MKKKILISLILIVICSSMTLYSFASSLDDLSDKKEDAKEELEDIKAEKSEILDEISKLSAQIEESQIELNKLNSQVKELERSISNSEKQIIEAEADYNKQKEMLETRVVAQYKNGKASYLDVLLNSTSLSTFISNYFLVGKVAKADNDLMEEISAKKIEIEKEKEKMEQERSEVKIAKASAEKENVKIKNAKVQKNSKVANLSEKEKTIQEQIDAYDKEMDEIRNQIANSGSGGGSYNGGTLAWPTPGYTKITSHFGMRLHPIFHVMKLHAGIDVGAPRGANFVAAESGTVITSTYSSSYGNMIVINHGNGLSTLYAHGTSRLVSAGQKVTRGQPVLTVGSTGNSTGNHAHFEVRVNGSPVNPLPYIQ